MDVLVSEVMKKKLLTLHPKDKLERAIEIFKTYDIHHIPIVVMNEVRGIVSQGDILFLKGIIERSYNQFVENQQIETMEIEDIMSINPVCINQDDKLVEACRLMTSHRINALPVLKENELSGLITSYDILSYLQTKG